MKTSGLNGFVIPGRLLCKQTRNLDRSALCDAEIPDGRSAVSGMTNVFSITPTGASPGNGPNSARLQ